VKHVLELLLQAFEEDQHAGDLYAAAGGPGGRAHDHQKQQQRPAELRPFVKICGGKARRGHHGHHLEGGVAHGVRRREPVEDVQRNGRVETSKMPV
jgi:hypothetical protein